MFSFQAIHNSMPSWQRTNQMSKNLYQCFLFKQFTTIIVNFKFILKCQRTFINVFFSSNSQLFPILSLFLSNVKEPLSMFSFQAIHNSLRDHELPLVNVKEPLSMFSFQAIHNSHVVQLCSFHNVKEPLSMFSFQAIHNSTARCSFST